MPIDTRLRIVRIPFCLLPSFAHRYVLQRYIKALHSYLLSFTKRAQPLVDVDTQQKEAEVQFNQQWESGEIEGWVELKGKEAASGESDEQGIWCSACEYATLFLGI